MKKAGTLKQGSNLPRVRVGQPIGFGQGRSAYHRSSRERILRRDNGLCQCIDCKSGGLLNIAHEVDHIDNRRGPGYDDDRNRAAINRECHRRKTQLEALIGRGLAERPAWMDRTTWMAF